MFRRCWEGHGEEAECWSHTAPGFVGQRAEAGLASGNVVEHGLVMGKESESSPSDGVGRQVG